MLAEHKTFLFLKCFLLISFNLSLCVLTNLRFPKNFTFLTPSFFKKTFDFVYICCPNYNHEKYILKSLNSNFNVICEKPFIIRKKNLTHT